MNRSLPGRDSRRDGTHRDLCSGLVRRLEPEDATARKPWLAELASRLGTAIPGGVDDPKRPLELGRRAASADGQNSNYLLARGAAEFCAGQFPSAVEVLGRAVARCDQPPVRAQAHLFMAMAHHRLGRAAEARLALAEADRDLARARPEPDPVTLQRTWHWREQTLARVVRHEAGELLGVPPAPGRKD